MTRPTIAVLMHDGFYSCGTGAGRSNRAFLQSLIHHMQPSTRLAVLPIQLVPESSEYNPQWHQEMHDLVQRANGQVLPVDNGTAGQRRFGDLDAFQHACASAASMLNSHIVPSAGPLLTVALDCPFYGLAAELSPTARPSLVVVARSTAALHAPEDIARIRWERDGLHQLLSGGGRVAAISAHMRAHLTTDYGVPDTAVLGLPNGLTSDDWKHIAAPDTSLLPTAARSGFMLAMGRAVPYKGFDDLVDALALLKARGVQVPHTVLAAVTDDPVPSPYQQHLARQIRAQRLNATLVPRFDAGLRSLLVHPALAAVVVPSRSEPFGRIPLEAFLAGAAPVVATTAGGLAELVTDQTGIRARPADPASLADALTRALAASTTQRARLRAAGRHLATTRYNHDKTVRKFLGHVAPWAVKRTEAAQSPQRADNAPAAPGP